MTLGLTIWYLIVIYVIGAFLTALAIGFFDMDDKEFNSFVIFLWPLSLIVIGAVIIGDAIEEWANQNPNITHRICNIFDIITIPFRPITFGRKIREWFDNQSCKPKGEIDGSK